MFKEKKDVDLFYKNVKMGDTIRVVRDLSNGSLDKNMIQEMTVKIYPENRAKIYEIIRKFPVLLLEVEK